MILEVPITRDGQKMNLPMNQCSKTELIDYFGTLPPKAFQSWFYLLLGYSHGASAKIQDLEERVATLTNLLGKTQKQRDFALAQNQTTPSENRKYSN